MPPRKTRTIKIEYEPETSDVAAGGTESSGTRRTGRGRNNAKTSEKAGSKNVETVAETLETVDKDSVPIAQSPAKGKRGRKGSKEETESKQPKFVPANWETVLANIQEMRKNKDAPVDSMGCERTMEEEVQPKVGY